jgi:hypothetical protein
MSASHCSSIPDGNRISTPGNHCIFRIRIINLFSARKNFQPALRFVWVCRRRINVPYIQNIHRLKWHMIIIHISSATKGSIKFGGNFRYKIKN